LAGRASERYHSQKVSPLSTRTTALKRLVEQALEVPDLASLTRLLTEKLPFALRIPSVTLLLWDRKLDSFEEHPRSHSQPEASAGDRGARYLVTEGRVLDNPGGSHDGALLPLMARSGLVGMLVLSARRGGRKRSYPPAEARLLTTLANRAALAVENHLYQSELIASERLAALGTLAGMLAHDFRGPMTVIRGYAETMMDAGVSEAEVRERAGLIAQMVDRLERMTSETLDFARVGSRLARRTLPLRGLLEELAESIALEIPDLAVSRDFDVGAGASAAVDVDKLRRVVGNLAANARDAMGGGGRLSLIARVLATEPAGGQAAPRSLSLIVADEGPGVPAALAERLFEPFVTQGKKSGTGLGLAVAKRFVEDHGGSLELLPDGPGARFHILLPLEAPAESR
jgi:signal transduction histidine kinase